MHYLVTGHTGFKGAWLALMLAEQGHQVSGIALDPEPGALFETARLHEVMTHDIRADIRDPAAVGHALALTRPDVVVHMAAQPLVRESYLDPRWTMETNVMGTFNVLEAVGHSPSVQAHLVVTTDKVYRNVDREEGYAEGEALGGHDPYSASKAMADILTQSWTHSFPGAPTAVARAGNVIGGGDVSKDRLLPDLLAGFADGRPVAIRYPDAVRPWQHVLDCLQGYLTLVDGVLAGTATGEWNFGPSADSLVTVREVADRAAALWGSGAAWVDASAGEHPHEANLLALDTRKARSLLGWDDRLPFDDAVAWTVEWAQRHAAGDDARDLCVEQIQAFQGRGR